jgi:hypothetical protein
VLVAPPLAHPRVHISGPAVEVVKALALALEAARGHVTRLLMAGLVKRMMMMMVMLLWLLRMTVAGPQHGANSKLMQGRRRFLCKQLFSIIFSMKKICLSPGFFF